MRTTICNRVTSVELTVAQF